MGDLTVHGAFLLSMAQALFAIVFTLHPCGSLVAVSGTDHLTAPRSPAAIWLAHGPSSLSSFIFISAPCCKYSTVQKNGAYDSHRGFMSLLPIRTIDRSTRSGSERFSKR